MLFWGVKLFLEVGEWSKISSSFLDKPPTGEDVTEIVCDRSIFLIGLAKKQVVLRDAGLENFQLKQAY